MFVIAVVATAVAVAAVVFLWMTGYGIPLLPLQSDLCLLSHRLSLSGRWQGIEPRPLSAGRVPSLGVVVAGFAVVVFVVAVVAAAVVMVVVAVVVVVVVVVVAMVVVVVVVMVVVMVVVIAVVLTVVIVVVMVVVEVDVLAVVVVVVVSMTPGHLSCYLLLLSSMFVGSVLCFHKKPIWFPSGLSFVSRCRTIFVAN